MSLLPTPSRKHANEELIRYDKLDGGINLSVPSEMLPQNEFNDALNVEYTPDGLSIRPRGGLRRVTDFGPHGENIYGCAIAPGFNRFVAKDASNKHIFTFPVGTSVQDNGDPKILNPGDYRDVLSITSWDKSSQEGILKEIFLVGADAAIIAIEDAGTSSSSGLPNSPKGRNVFTWGSRVGTNAGGGQIKLSAVGDCYAWANTPNNLSSAQSLNIGYKDGLDIRAITSISGDLIVFKGKRYLPGDGDIWRVSGYIPNTVVQKIVAGVGTMNQNTVCIAGNDIFFLSRHGLATLSSVVEYGDFKLSWLDAKVAKEIVGKLDLYSAIWHIPHMGQLWIGNTQSRDVWVFHYRIKAWTRFQFPEPVTFACSLSIGNSQPKTYVVSKSVIYTLDETVDTDHGTTAPFKALVRFGTLRRPRETLIKGVGVSYSCKPGASAALEIGNWKIPLLSSARSVYVSEDSRIAFDNNAPVVSEWGSQTLRSRVLVRGYSITPEIVFNGQGCQLHQMFLNVAGV